MSLAILTKKHIMESFKKLTLHTPFYKISTLDVVKLSGINKNTFYYHFDDKYDLIRAIFRIEFGEMLLETFNRDMLVFSDEITDKYSEMPHYINARNRKDNLDYSAFFEVIGEYFKANLPYYSNVFRSEIPEGFKYYFRNLYLNEMRKDLLYLLDDFELPENNTEFIAGYFTDSCFGWLVRMPSENKGNLDMSHGFDYNNITHELMKLFVEKLKNR